MSSVQDTPGSQSSKPQRVLACVLCQQRKIKCDRKFPCAHCIKSQAQCVPATQLPRRRRRRFPERDLLDQLRKYEDLLRQNNINFKPLHKDPTGTNDTSNGNDTDEETPGGTDGSTPSTTVAAGGSEKFKEIKNFWHAMREGFEDLDENDEPSSGRRGDDAIRKAWDAADLTDEPLMFGARQHAVDLSTFHPDPVQIFRLWQLFLENVNPIVKVVHAPTLQARIVEAIGNMKSVSPVLEALMFSIFSMAVLSLYEDDCLAMLGSSQKDLLTKYQFGCQQALLNCGFLRCNERDCLTALHLYLTSLAITADPRSLSSLTGLMIRIAQRMKIDSEAENIRVGVLEGEMRRRLWWAIVIFDIRVCALADYKSHVFTPIWDCKPPRNVNDADLRPEMIDPPAVHSQPTEALLAVVRAEVGDFGRNSNIHLGNTYPHLMPIAQKRQSGFLLEGGEIAQIERMVEDKYLRYCDPENPLHFMAIWDSRGHFARWRLMEAYTACSSSDASQVEANLGAAVRHALRLLECDTKIMNSPLTKGFRWMTLYHFPAPAYLHLVNHLRKRPLSPQADEAWQAMTDNYASRFYQSFQQHDPIFRMFIKLVLSAWRAREAAAVQLGEVVAPPGIVLKLQEYADQKSSKSSQGMEAQWTNASPSVDPNDFSTPTSMDFGDPALTFGMDEASGFGGTTAGAFDTIPGQVPLDMNMGQLNWPGMNWGMWQRPTW